MLITVSMYCAMMSKWWFRWLVVQLFIKNSKVFFFVTATTLHAFRVISRVLSRKYSAKYKLHICFLFANLWYNVHNKHLTAHSILLSENKSILLHTTLHGKVSLLNVSNINVDHAADRKFYETNADTSLHTIICLTTIWYILQFYI